MVVLREDVGGPVVVVVQHDVGLSLRVRLLLVGVRVVRVVRVVGDYSGVIMLLVRGRVVLKGDLMSLLRLCVLIERHRGHKVLLKLRERVVFGHVRRVRVDVSVLRGARRLSGVASVLHLGDGLHGLFFARERVARRIVALARVVAVAAAVRLGELVARLGVDGAASAVFDVVVGRSDGSVASFGLDLTFDRVVRKARQLFLFFVDLELLLFNAPPRSEFLFKKSPAIISCSGI